MGVKKNRNNKKILIVRSEDLKSNANASFAEIFKFHNIKAKINVDSLTEFVETDIRTKWPVYGWQKSYRQYKLFIDKINIDLKKVIVLLNYPQH